jgi:hypothetical protein
MTVITLSTVGFTEVHPLDNNGSWWQSEQWKTCRVSGRNSVAEVIRYAPHMHPGNAI